MLTYQVGLADATYAPSADGQYEVSLTLEAQQLQTTGLGEQQSQPLNLPVTIELNDAEGNSIEVIKPVLTDTQTTLTLITNELPSSAAIDPDYRLPSAYLQDNVKQIRPVQPTRPTATNTEP